MCVCVCFGMCVSSLALCVLGCNQQRFLCGLLCSLIGVLANNRGREEECVSFPASCVAAAASELEEPLLWFGAALGALALYTSAASNPSIYYISVCPRVTMCLSACVCCRTDLIPMLAAVSFV